MQRNEFDPTARRGAFAQLLRKIANAKGPSPEQKQDLLRQASNLEKLTARPANLSGAQLKSSLDPEVMQNDITLAGFHLEADARSFAAHREAMIEDLGEAVRPYLRGRYEAMRYLPNFDGAGMSTAAEIDAGAAESASAKKAEDKRGIGENSKMLDQLASKLMTLLHELTPQETNEGWSQILYEWELSNLIPVVLSVTMEGPNPFALIEAASGPLTDRLNFNRNNEFARAMTAMTLQEFSDAIR